MIVQLNSWLYLGDWQSVAQGEYRNFPIGAILCVNENNERVFPHSGNNINYLWCSFNDPGETLTAEKLKICSQFASLFKAHGVLVHCYGGANRSSAICAYLLCTTDGIPAEQACALVFSQNNRMGIRGELTAKIHQLTSFMIGNP